MKELIELKDYLNKCIAGNGASYESLFHGGMYLTFYWEVGDFLEICRVDDDSWDRIVHVDIDDAITLESLVELLNDYMEVAAI